MKQGNVNQDKNDSDYDDLDHGDININGDIKNVL